MQMVFPQGLLGPMVSPENLWILEIPVKGSIRVIRQLSARWKRKYPVYSCKSAAIPDPQH